MVQVKTEFNLVIYPNGQGWEQRDDDNFIPTKMYFPDAETKASYVAAEYNFCKNERAAFNGALTSSERKELHVKLITRQAYFAKQCGYAPSMKDRKQWFYNPNDGKILA